MDLIIHGHFYQPPREDPWTDEVPREASAAPFHDWNERILAECYRPNAFARLFAGDRILGVANNYEALSFNFGATLSAWLERHDPTILARVAAADRRSTQARQGHGNAIAQAFHHTILPLADPLDRATHIRWGLAEFRHLYGREAEAMWLPETAADNATLGDLIDHGMSYAILAPRQAARVRPPGGAWRGAGRGLVDSSRPYRYLHRDGSGRALAIYFYDGPLAQALAFGDALESSEKLLGALQAAAARAGEGGLVHAAVDGETFGHHHRWGERALAWTLFQEAPRRGWRVTNYGEHLASHPPTWEVELDLGPLGEGSSWSCAHGVGRWQRDCGCRFRAGTSQAWRAPLRAALDLLRDRARPFFAEAAGALLRDPWAARDAYVGVLLVPTPRRRERFLTRHGRAELLPRERQRALDLLEMQRRLLRMYASCGWFFDDVAGLESQLVLRQAGRALELWRCLGGEPPQEDFFALLGEARSNDPVLGTGADVFRRVAKPARRASIAVSGLPAHSVVRELRRWLDEGRGENAEERAADLLRAIQADRSSGAAGLERAQEIFWLRVIEAGEEPPLAMEVARALGFAEELARTPSSWGWRGKETA